MKRIEPERLRPPPRERFAPDTLAFDLELAFQRLAEESHEGVDGHRQITLFKGGSFTVVAFLFDADGTFPRHQADGIVTLHLLDGHLDVHTNTGRFALGEHGLLVLQPQVPFSVHADRESRMVMTVHLNQ